MQPFDWRKGGGGDLLARERGQALLRIIVSAVATLYLVYASAGAESTEENPPWLVIGSYAVFAGGLFLRILRSTSSPLLRRTLANVGDMGVVTYTMIAGGESAMPLFTLYLWITLGNAFRFGERALLVSAVLGFSGFSIVVLATEAWQKHEMLAVAVFLALMALPVYAWRRIVQLKGARLAARSALSRLSTTFRWLSPADGNTLGRERGQALLRVVISTVVTFYLIISQPLIPTTNQTPPSVVIAAYAIFAIGLFWHILRSPTSSAIRRYFAILADASAITYAMTASGEAGMPLFLLYLWITLGNGFRFGERALLVSALLCIVGFSTVVTMTDAWRDHPALSTSVFLALIILPAYAAHLIRQLNRALAQAQEASAAKSDFLARMSHELRTPLNGILGASELFQSGRRLTPEERELLQVIRDSVQVSLRQINNVLNFSKLEAGKLLLENTDFDLHETINNALDIVRPAAAQKGLRLLVRIAPNVPFRLLGDAHHLRAILLNLLSNAVKFTEGGQVCVEVSARDESDGKARVRIEVHDTGIGIAPNALNHIFESFSQEDSSTERRYGGSGLGTTIAKQLTELMGGRMGVESVKGQGSVFWFEVPFDRQNQTGRDPDQLVTTRALLLSKDASLAQHYLCTIEALGGQVIPAQTAGEAAEILARAVRLGNPARAILVDASAAIGDDGQHQCEDLCTKCAAADVGVILVGDIAPPASQLRQWGYSSVLPARADPDLVFSALHAIQARAATSPAHVVSVAPWMWGRRDGVRRRLLLADDNRTNLMIVRRMLEQAGYDVDVAENGDEALERLCEGNYRLAVLDMHMPGLDGLAVLRRYRLLRPRSRAPVLILTANVSLEAQGQCADAGADAYLAKPVTAADLLNEIERLLKINEVEVLKRQEDTAAATNTEDDRVLDVSVIAELDRLYHNPPELAAMIAEYEREGRNYLERIAQACSTRNHAAFCDAVHALKGNAANVGAIRLLRACRHAEGAGMVEFMRDRDRMLADMRQTFSESLVALREQLPASLPDRGGEAGDMH